MGKDNGGPAFPVQEFGFPNDESFNGMSMLDYFAAKALQSLISALLSGDFKSKDGGLLNESLIAEQAYEFAKAMIAERAK